MKLGKFGAVIDSAMDTSGITPNVGNMVKSYGLFVDDDVCLLPYKDFMVYSSGQMNEN